MYKHKCTAPLFLDLEPQSSQLVYSVDAHAGNIRARAVLRGGGILPPPPHTHTPDSSSIHSSTPVIFTHSPSSHAYLLPLLPSPLSQTTQCSSPPALTSDCRRLSDSSSRGRVDGWSGCSRASAPCSDMVLKAEKAVTSGCCFLLTSTSFCLRQLPRHTFWRYLILKYSYRHDLAHRSNGN